MCFGIFGRVLVLGLVAWVGVCWGADGVVLVREGKPLARVYLAEEVVVKPKLKKRAGLTLEQYGDFCQQQMLEELNYHVETMGGRKLEVVHGASRDEVTAPAIVLGKLAVELGAAPPVSDSGEGFHLTTVDGRVLIGGESPAGTMYGVYELLRQLGCDWVMPGEAGEVIPERQDIVVPALDVTESPSFAIRNPWYTWKTKEELAEFQVWKLRHKNQARAAWGAGVSRTHFHPLDMRGGHVWDVLTRKYRADFEANPELLALVRQPDGSLVRKGPQIESTAPGTLDIFEKYIAATFKKYGWENDRKVCLGVGPADGMGYSESPESLSAGSNRVDPITGFSDITDLQILLCNQLLERLEERYPNLYLGFYLYSTHADYPMRYKPHPKVMIVIADINYSRFHANGDRNSKSRTYLHDILEQWKRLHEEQGNPMMFRGYNWNLAENLLPYTKLKIWGEDLPYYKSMGCSGTYVQWAKNWSNTGPSDYLEARMNWDTSLDWREVLREYCESAFGKGAAQMEAYYLMLVERQHGSGMEAGSYHAYHLMFDEAFMAEADRLFEAAEAAAETEKQKQMVRWQHIPLEFLAQYLDYRAAFTSFDFVTAKARSEKLVSTWQGYYDENSNLVDTMGPKYLKRYHAAFIEQGVTYSTGDYRIVMPLPDRLKTMLDPYVKGQEMGFQNPELNDTYLMETATWSVPWDAQGLAGHRDGAVWYRVEVEIPKDLEGKAIGLFIGGVDDLARVWLNGEYIGMGRSFSKPFLFDLTDEVRYGEKNLLAIQTQRYSKASELGLGGIIYPSFVFTGPRLERKAPQEKRLRRILPGGSEGELE